MRDPKYINWEYNFFDVCICFDRNRNWKKEASLLSLTIRLKNHMKKKSGNKTKKIQKVKISEISELFNSTNNVDASLRAKLSPEGYSRLNQIIAKNVQQAYYQRMKPLRATLLENRELVEQKNNFSTPLASGNQNTKNWRKNPNNLTDEQLIEEIIKLNDLVNIQLSENQNLKGEVEIIRLAAEQMEIERQNLFLTLKEMELRSNE